MNKILAALAALLSLALLGCGTNNAVLTEPELSETRGGCIPSIWTTIDDSMLGMVWESDCGDMTTELIAQNFAENIWSSGMEPEDYYGHIDPPRGPRRDYPIHRIDDLTHVWESYDSVWEDSLAIPATDWELGTTFVLMP